MKLGGRNTKPEGGKRAPDDAKIRQATRFGSSGPDGFRALQIHDLLIPSGGIVHVLFLSTDRTLSEHWRCARVGPTAVCN